MKEKLITTILGALISRLTPEPEILKGFIDQGLDYIEDRVADSKTKIDDVTILPLCALIRDALDVPDND